MLNLRFTYLHTYLLTIVIARTIRVQDIVEDGLRDMFFCVTV